MVSDLVNTEAGSFESLVGFKLFPSNIKFFDFVEFSQIQFFFRKKIKTLRKKFETNPLLFHPTIKHIAASGTRMTLMNF